MENPYAGIEPVFTSKITVELIGQYGGDWLIADAARVSSRHGEGSGPRDCSEIPADSGLIKSLIKNRHGGPFGHGGLTFFVEAPIFVFREWRTHRVYMTQSTDDFSYSEASARYRPVIGKFWVPDRDRMLIKAGDHKPMRPSFVIAKPDEYTRLLWVMEQTVIDAWKAYQAALEDNIAPEVARAMLPVSLYSAMYVSCNPRSLMHFLSLRVRSEDSLVPTYPQLEIQTAAKAIEEVFAAGWPVTYTHWVANGRTSV
jgi:thymidylate synthase (FAD)